MSLKLRSSLYAGLAAFIPALNAIAADVGVSVNVGQPGFYGRIDIGNVSPPVIYAQPLVIAPASIAVVQRPIYLRVPPGHAKKWSKHCARYDACRQQTYFVREDWYTNVYAPSRGLPYQQAQHHGNYAPVNRAEGPRHRERGYSNGKHYGREQSSGRGKDHGKGHRNQR